MPLTVDGVAPITRQRFCVIVQQAGGLASDLMGLFCCCDSSGHSADIAGFEWSTAVVRSGADLADHNLELLNVHFTQ